MLFRSQIITDASGSIGGLTAFRSKGGLAMRSRVVPVNPATTQQLAIRNAMAAAATAWRGLTQTQRDGWEAYAVATPLPGKLGGTVNVGGEAMFCRCNSIRVQSGLAIVSPPPVATGTGDIPGLVFNPLVAGSPGTVSIAFTTGAGTTWSNVVGAAMLIYLARTAISPGRNFFKGPYRYVARINGAASPPTSPQIVPALATLASGDKYAGYVRVTRADGRLTQPYRFLLQVP